VQLHFALMNRPSREFLARLSENKNALTHLSRFCCESWRVDEVGGLGLGSRARIQVKHPLWRRRSQGNYALTRGHRSQRATLPTGLSFVMMLDLITSVMFRTSCSDGGRGGRRFLDLRTFPRVQWSIHTAHLLSARIHSSARNSCTSLSDFSPIYSSTRKHCRFRASPASRLFY